jgi:uncharacterized protein YdaU (DUF1376 family)
MALEALEAHPPLSPPAREVRSLQPWFRFYTKDYLADSRVRLLAREDRSILVDCWCYCSLDGSLPADPLALGRLLGVDRRKMASTLLRLLPFFECEGGRLHSVRLSREADSDQAKRDRMRENGKQGGRPKKATGSGNGKQIQPEPEAGAPDGHLPSAPPQPVPMRPPRKLAAPKVKGRGPNAHLPEELQPIFWEAVKAFPPEKRINSTLAAKGFAGAVALGLATGPELAGCMKRYRATFPENRVAYMTQAHAWLEGAGFLAFLDAERAGEKIRPAQDPNRPAARGECLTSAGSGLENYVMPDYVPPPRRAIA